MQVITGRETIPLGPSARVQYVKVRTTLGVMMLATMKGQEESPEADR